MRHRGLAPDALIGQRRTGGKVFLNSPDKKKRPKGRFSFCQVVDSKGVST
jgi:hypothetical protein